MVLFALVDADYNFMFIEVGQPGSVNDASVWQVYKYYLKPQKIKYFCYSNTLSPKYGEKAKTQLKMSEPYI